MPDTVQVRNLVLLKSGNKPEKWFAISVDAANDEQSISTDSNMSQKLLGRKVGDIIDFGPISEILEIRKYLG